MKANHMKVRSRASLLFLVIAAIIMSSQSVEAADTIYSIPGGFTYNGSDDGYIMSYDWPGGASSGLRVAFSANRPGYQLGKSIGVYIRTDGYYSRDCGWWYTVPGADVTLDIYKPGESTPNVTVTGTTGSNGVWESVTFLKLTRAYPMGVYKLNATVSKTGLTTVGDDAPGNMTIYVDVAGDLVLTEQVNKTVNIYENITIWGEVKQPNGQYYTENTTYIHAGIVNPDETYNETTYTISQGQYTYSMQYNATQIGHYFIVVTANSTIGGQVARGRASNNSVGTGEWPPAEASFAGPAIRATIAIILALTLFPPIRRRVRRKSEG